MKIASLVLSWTFSWVQGWRLKFLQEGFMNELKRGEATLCTEYPRGQMQIETYILYDPPFRTIVCKF